VDSNLPIETLGSQIAAHVTAGDRAHEKAEQHYKAAGIHLIEARARIALRKDLTWTAFLIGHCGLKKARSYELIALAEGKTTLEELRQQKAASMARSRVAKQEKSPQRCGQSAEKTQQNQQPTPQEPPSDEREVLLQALFLRMRSATLEELRFLEKCLDAGLGN
jgi:hypothetical protein